MVNASWGLIQQAWNDCLGALFGSNVVLTGLFFAIFFIYIFVRVGLSSEVAVPFALLMVFMLTVMSSLLPANAWTVAILLSAILVYLAAKKVFWG